MKKTWILVVAVLLGTTSFAQIQKGKVFLNGQMGFYSQKYENNDERKEGNFFLNPSVGFFVSNKVALGTGVGVEHTKSKGSRFFGDSKATIFRIAPFARFYFGNSEKFNFFLQPKLALGFGKQKFMYNSPFENVEMEFKSTDIDFSLSPGFAYMPSKHWAFEFLIRGFYVYANNPEGDNNNYTSTGFSINSATQPTRLLGTYMNGTFVINQETNVVNAFNPTIGISYFF